MRQIVSRFVFFRDQQDPFLRTVMQERLRNALPEFVVSDSDRHCASIQGFLREVVLSIRFLAVRFSIEYLSSVPRKRLYKDLADVLLPIPRVRRFRSLYCGGPGQDVLKRVNKMPVKPSM
ncbi:unnamed protein product [Ixodes hexagonus]